MLTESTRRSGDGSLFHARGAARANERSPIDNVVRGTATEPEVAGQINLIIKWHIISNRQNAVAHILTYNVNAHILTAVLCCIFSLTARNTLTLLMTDFLLVAYFLATLYVLWFMHSLYDGASIHHVKLSRACTHRTQNSPQTRIAPLFSPDIGATLIIYLITYNDIFCINVIM